MSNNEISNALMNAYDIKKNSYFKKIKDRILDEGISDSSEYTIGDCLDDLINSLEKSSDNPPPPSHESGSGFFISFFIYQ